MGGPTDLSSTTEAGAPVRPAIQRSFSQHRGVCPSAPISLSIDRSGHSEDSSSSLDERSPGDLGDSPAATPSSASTWSYSSRSRGEPTAKLDSTLLKPISGAAHVATSLMTAPPNMSGFGVPPPLQSPCYVHSHLDLKRRPSTGSAGGSTNNGGYNFPNPHSASPFQTKHNKKRDAAAPIHPTTSWNLAKSPQGDADDTVRTSRMLHRLAEQQVNKDADAVDDASDGSMTEEGEDDEASTLTRRLAETATSVREMSKQLGRARVKSSINSILIITKARDNHLIKLTRELAIWIMTEMRPASSKERGVICYVDSQLEKSKRFDAAGIERDYPHLFRPLVRRFSRRSSLSRNNSINLPDIKRTHSQFVNNIRPLSTTEPRSGSASAPTQSPKVSPPQSVASSEPETGTNGIKDDGQKGQLRYWTSEMCQNSPHLFDFVVTLGGDGTVLFASWLFQRIVPPVIPFALGSLGFLTNFDYLNYKSTLKSILNDGVRINLRMRFTCTVYRAAETGAARRAVRSGQTGEIFTNDLASGGWDSIESGAVHAQPSKKDKEVLCFTTKPAEQFEVINDLVVDRGPSPYVSLLELFGDEHHMTTVQADGLCVATPTGSTAYSLSAGGSLVHPESPAILVSPICPHTLSFRPIILPDSMELRIVVPYNSRSTAWASFDGRGRVELRQGDHIKITASPYPFPTVCKDKQSTDWFSSIARTLKWNERQRQKSFVVIEEDRSEPGEKDTQATNNPDQRLAGTVDEHDAEAEEDEGYDIDEISSAEASLPASPKEQGLDKPGTTSRTTQTFLSLPSGSELELETEEAGRWKDPAPRAPPVSRRHTYEMYTAPEMVATPRLRKHSKQGRATNQQLQEAGPSIGGSSLRMPSDQLSHRKSTNSQRAFAVFGDDESDASLSESDASEIS